MPLRSADEIERLEAEIETELVQMARAGNSGLDPIMDGTVDTQQYLAASPKILWILKEPWDEIDEDGKVGGGGWSVTKNVVAKGLDQDDGTLARMAYVTHAVYTGYIPESAVRYVTHDADVAHALKRVAYINVSKSPGHKTSVRAFIAQQYQKNRSILLRQIEAYAPDIIIGGNTLSLFFADFGLRSELFAKNGSNSFCLSNGRLFVDALHPGQRRLTRATWVDDIVSTIRENAPTTV